MSFDYEQSIWGRGYASLSPTVLASWRLRQAIQALEKIPAGGRVLEFGAGAGQFIRSVKKVRSDLDCYGCDISTKAIELAQTVPDSVHYAENGATTPYTDGFFDAVLIFDVLEHVENPKAILAEIYRVLKSGGVLYAYVPCEGDSLSFWNWCRRRGWKGDLTKKYAGHINYFSRASLQQLYKDSGFTVVSFRYSEHLLGQLLGFVAFNLLDRAAKRRGVEQINGEDYFLSLDAAAPNKSLFRFVKNVINSLVYFESWLFSRLPSPNVHSIVKK